MMKSAEISLGLFTAGVSVLCSYGSIQSLYSIRITRTNRRFRLRINMIEFENFVYVPFVIQRVKGQSFLRHEKVKETSKHQSSANLSAGCFKKW